MNEEQIAKRQQQNIPAQEEPVQSQPTPESTPSDTGYTYDVGDATDMYKLYDFFHVESAFRSPEAEQKIQTIYRWAAEQAQSTDYLAVAKVLSRLEQGMSGGFTESHRLDKVYSVVKIQLQMQKLQQEQALIYG